MDFSSYHLIHARFYTDPVLVLDFQSLYPSMIIAYNYCYSTCLGRTHLLGKYGENTAQFTLVFIYLI